MEVGLVLFALLVVFVTLRRGRRFDDSYREFPGIHSKDKSDSQNLYGRHTQNHLYPDPGDEISMHSDHSSKAS